MSRIKKITLGLFAASILLLPLTAHAHSAPINTLVIGLDASGSMRGTGIKESISATNQLVTGLTNIKTLKIFTFTDKVIPLGDVKDLASVKGGGETALYDTIWQLALISRDLGASLIIFTDGKDSKSKFSPYELNNRLSALPVAVNFVVYKPQPEDLQVLNTISKAHGGQVYQARDTKSLIEVFGQAVSAIDTSAPKNPAIAQPKVEKVQSTTESGFNFFALIMAIAVALISYLVFKLVSDWQEQDRLKGTWSTLLENYQSRSAESEDNRNTSANALPAIWPKNWQRHPISKWVGDTSLIAPKIRDGRKREFLFVLILIASAVLLLLINIPLLVVIPLTTITGLLLLRSMANSAMTKLQKDFETELPSALKLIASSLSGGLSFLQALDSFSSDGKGQVAFEFRRALSEIQMGAPIERALGDVAERMKSEDLKWVVFAFTVQREVGGGLAKILQSCAETIEERASLRQEIRTLSAEGRISAYVLMLLPIGIFAFLSLFKPEFIALFWQESIGQAMLLLVVLLMTGSWIWMQNLIKVRT